MLPGYSDLATTDPELGTGMECGKKHKKAHRDIKTVTVPGLVERHLRA